MTTETLAPPAGPLSREQRAAWAGMFDVVVQVAREVSTDDLTLTRTVLRHCAPDLLTAPEATTRQLRMVAATGAHRLACRYARATADNVLDGDSTACDLARALVRAIRAHHPVDATLVLREALELAGPAGVVAIIVRLAAWVATVERHAREP